MASGYTPLSPDPEPKASHRPMKPQQQEEKEEEILIGKCPPGVHDDSVKTFIFKKQGHTLGNVLRDQIIKYKEISFCGYSIPHPGENEMHLRIQTVPGCTSTATDLLRKGLEDIMEMCDHVESVFTADLQKKQYETEPA